MLQKYRKKLQTTRTIRNNINNAKHYKIYSVCENMFVWQIVLTIQFLLGQDRHTHRQTDSTFHLFCSAQQDTYVMNHVTVKCVGC